MFTPRILTELADSRKSNALARTADTWNKRIQRETAAMNGQVMRVRGGGKRVAEPWTNGRWNPNDPTKATGAVGMASHAHVSRNLKTAKLKRYVAPRWKAAPMPMASAQRIVGYTKKGRAKWRRRELGTDAYDPRVRFGKLTGKIVRVVRFGRRLVGMEV